MNTTVAQGATRHNSPELPTSPEQLDRVIEITEPKSWLALGAIWLLIGAALIWGIFGKIATTVDGEGVLMQDGGQIYSVEAFDDGRIQQILIEEGDKVKKGQLMFFVAQPDLEQGIADAQLVLKTLQGRRSDQHAYYDTYLAQQAKNLQSQRAAAQSLIRHAEDTIARNSEAAKIPGSDAIQNVFVAEEERSKAQGDLTELDSRHLELVNERATAMAVLDLQIITAQNTLRELQVRLTSSTLIDAPDAGTVTEIRVNLGNTVSTGATLANIETGGSGLEALVYVPVGDGKEIEIGMSVFVSPSTVNEEEYGMMLGQVDSISELSASKPSIMRVLGNQQLVDAFTDDGPVLTMRVKLETDASTDSGYKWSSRAGPPSQLSAGTVVTASVQVTEQPPLNLVIPYLKRQTGL